MNTCCLTGPRNIIFVFCSFIFNPALILLQLRSSSLSLSLSFRFITTITARIHCFLTEHFENSSDNILWKALYPLIMFLRFEKKVFQCLLMLLLPSSNGRHQWRMENYVCRKPFHITWALSEVKLSLALSPTFRLPLCSSWMSSTSCISVGFLQCHQVAHTSVSGGSSFAE